MTSSSQADKNIKTDEVSFVEIMESISNVFKYLRSKWVIIVLFCLIGGGVGFIYSYLKKPTYTAITTFVLEEEKSGGGLGSLAGLASIAGVDLAGGGGGIFQGDNILELYKSRKMIEKTLLSPALDGSNELLIDRYVLFSGLKKNWEKDSKLSNFHFFSDINKEDKGIRRLQDSVIGFIVDNINKKNLIVDKLDKKLNIIKVDVTAPDEIFAKRFNDQMVENVNDFYKQTKTKKSLDNIAILQRKTDSVRAVMNGEIYQAAVVADATPNLNPTRQVQRSAPVQKAQFSAETNKAVLSTLIQNLEMSKMALLKETPLVQVIDTPLYPLIKTSTNGVISCLIGAILLGFLAIMFLSIKRFLKKQI
ncbi:lipopolysaccharide biosynthesis protein [Pedobacter sp. N36a]|uniref:Wzz/FepE/Etk N-terminal domain-containing protein n=1 Tax=Pedobacter sp. N36a TaxID=2767996 RepID=UPI0016575E0C|nr:Wzz/FepE/Etk N-terminal domain-containing protein [Pedobacter sp. N36a]MBC8986179.1 lipopolysaccharide biosynthesis protein [Pedobacter sp. N36a]